MSDSIREVLKKMKFADKEFLVKLREGSLKVAHIVIGSRANFQLISLGNQQKPLHQKLI